jgi:hypothetical protein
VRLCTPPEQAAEGPPAGKRIEPVPHANPFWFAWAAFKRETRIVG